MNNAVSLITKLVVVVSCVQPLYSTDTTLYTYYEELGYEVVHSGNGNDEDETRYKRDVLGNRNYEMNISNGIFESLFITEYEYY